MKTVPKIVVLEDARSSRTLITLFLEKAGYRVFEASEGRYAIELMLKERPALLIADVMVPEMNGAEVVKKLLEIHQGEVNVLFLTSLLNKDGEIGEETTLKAGGKEFPALGKPFDPKILLSVVDRLVGRVEQAEDASADDLDIEFAETEGEG